MDGPEWAAGKLSEDHKDNRWSLLSADLRELEQQMHELGAALNALEERVFKQETKPHDKEPGQGLVLSTCPGNDFTEFHERIELLEAVCEQCILEHQGRSI